MKKLLALVLSLMLMVTCFSFVGCSKGEAVDITIWVSEVEGVKELTQQQVDAFLKANKNINFNVTIEGISESEAATQMITSVEDGADIYCFAQDQLARLIAAGALSPLGQAAAAEVTANNDTGSVAAATVGSTVYCYPMTSDNGYFMYYDTSVIPEEDVDSLEAIIEDCEDAGKMFSFELENSVWYGASFFFATGCESTWTTDDDGAFTAVNDTFNSAEGIIAAQGMQKILKSSCYFNSSNVSDFSATTPSAVVISGTWGATDAKAALGDNYGVADLPSFTVGTTSYHLGSYSGYKLMGVKPQTDATKAANLQKLALYLTGETCQLERFESFSWGPSNKAAQANEAVLADAALTVLAQQNAYAVPQGQVASRWWDIGKVLTVAIKEATDTAGIQAALNTYDTSVAAIFSVPASEAEAFTVIGVGGDWNTDLAMTENTTEPGVWYSNEAITFEAGGEFQVRQGKAWDVQFGALGEDGFSTKNNFVVETAGKYFVKLVYDEEAGTGIVSLQKTSPIHGWTVIGLNGDWNTDLPMEIQADGTWLTTIAYEMDAGEEFKVRQGLAWDVSYGAGTGNYIVETAGTYYVKFNADNTIELIAG